MMREVLVAGALIAMAVALLFQLGMLEQRAPRQHRRSWEELVQRLELKPLGANRFRGTWRAEVFLLERGVAGVTVRVAVAGPLSALTFLPRARAVGEAPAQATAPARASARALWAWFDSAPDRWIEQGQLSATLPWEAVSAGAIHRLVEEMAAARRAIAEG